jgi:hypothetical protein
MNPIHPTPEQIDRYRTRAGAADELLAVDQHISECDRCHATLGRAASDEIVLDIAGESEHLTYDEMEQWLDGRADDVERELIEGHRDICDLCRNELADLARVRDAMRGAEAGASKQQTFVRMWLPIAAIVAIAAAGGLLFFQKNRVPHMEDRRSRPSGQAGLPVLQRPAIIATLAGETSALRSGEAGRATFSLRQPVATVVLDPRPQLRWETVAGARSYTVTVVDADTGAVSFTGTSRTDSLQLDQSLERGHPYSWQVSAHRGAEVITAPRPPAPEARFCVATREQADAIAALPKEAHLQRGILLAKQGSLDDAERELELAREPEARGLLDRVRSWRQPQWPSPTTTNAAQ